MTETKIVTLSLGKTAFSNVKKYMTCLQNNMWEFEMVVEN